MGTMQNISYTKQYDLNTGEMSYREAKYCEIAPAIEYSHAHLNNGGY